MLMVKKTNVMVFIVILSLFGCMYGCKKNSPGPSEPPLPTATPTPNNTPEPYGNAFIESNSVSSSKLYYVGTGTVSDSIDGNIHAKNYYVYNPTVTTQGYNASGTPTTTKSYGTANINIDAEIGSGFQTEGNNQQPLPTFYAELYQYHSNNTYTFFKKLTLTFGTTTGSCNKYTGAPSSCDSNICLSCVQQCVNAYKVALIASIPISGPLISSYDGTLMIYKQDYRIKIYTNPDNKWINYAWSPMFVIEGLPGDIDTPPVSTIPVPTLNIICQPVYTFTPTPSISQTVTITQTPGGPSPTITPTSSISPTETITKTSTITKTPTITPTCGDDKYEPDDTWAEALNLTPIALGTPQTHNFGHLNDVDYIVFNATAGQIYSVAIGCTSPQLVFTPQMTLFDSGYIDQLVASPITNWTCGTSGLYYVQISNMTELYGCNTNYCVEVVNGPPPIFTLTPTPTPTPYVYTP